MEMPHSTRAANGSSLIWTAATDKRDYAGLPRKEHMGGKSGPGGQGMRFGVRFKLGDPGHEGNNWWAQFERETQLWTMTTGNDIGELATMGTALMSVMRSLATGGGRGRKGSRERFF